MSHALGEQALTELVHAEWARVKPLIQAALATSPGLENIDDVEKFLTSGKYQLFTAPSSAAITEVAHFARKKVLVVVHGGGDLGELLGLLEPLMCEYAISRGCDAIMGTGRRGWERVTEKHGYRLAFINMIKELKQ